MQLFFTILHVFLCFALVLIILLQPGKEGAAAFGGAGNQMYGPRSQGHFLGRATTVVATTFMFTSITLAWYSSARTQADSDLEKGIDKVQQEDTKGFDVQVPSGSSTPAPTMELPGADNLDLQVPTDGSVAPADGTSAPAEGAAAPADGAAAPADGAAGPADGSAPATPPSP